MKTRHVGAAERDGALFRERPGFPGWSEREWVQWTAGDPSYRPAESVLALIHGRVVGFVTSADLVARMLQAWRIAGKEAVILDVNINNPGAIRLYVQLGFTVVRRRGKFSAKPL